MGRQQPMGRQGAKHQLSALRQPAATTAGAQHHTCKRYSWQHLLANPSGVYEKLLLQPCGHDPVKLNRAVEFLIVRVHHQDGLLRTTNSQVPQPPTGLWHGRRVDVSLCHNQLQPAHLMANTCSFRKVPASSASSLVILSTPWEYSASSKGLPTTFSSNWAMWLQW